MSIIYFDNAASAKPCDEAVDVFNAVIRENYANSMSLHKGGIEAERIITSSREALLALLPKNGDLIFTSGATESNNSALLGTAELRRESGRIVSTTIEHPSVARVLDKLSERGFEVTRLSPGNCRGDFEDYIAENSQGAFMVSVTAVCGETGFKIDTARVYSEIKRRFPGCTVHTDGSQGFLKVPLDGDLISLSAHKIGGIAGAGGLFVKNGVRLAARLFGGNQQKGLRPGTLPTALIAAFAKAAETSRPIDGALQKRLADGLNRLDGIKINSRDNVNNILNFSCGVKSEVMLHFLAEKGIYVSSGSACSKGKKSEILPSYGISGKALDSAIRVSFGRQNTAGEVDVFLERLEAGMKRFGGRPWN
ncbi:MAG: aminotransferase class V-fold PLP-dependent enzyme [Oscillospiraceae bacterium]|jgi:cysteine desulfurase|nr:aminotransferase class V-fold PLP-dependent enzyme [Oscillospiraceae bacterium]